VQLAPPAGPQPGGLVSILTRPEGRVQRRPTWPVRPARPGFNPHPPRRAGATGASPRTRHVVCRFQSSPAPKGGCNKLGTMWCEQSYQSFNPHPPRRAGATGSEWRRRGAGRQGGFNPHPPRRAGATLGSHLSHLAHGWFQSSPAPKGGCNRMLMGWCTWRWMFQSSPAPKGGCNPLFAADLPIPRIVSILTRPEGRVQLPRSRCPKIRCSEFQSSPAPKGGCNMARVAVRRGTSAGQFQSSPAPKGGCNWLCNAGSGVR